MPGASGWCATMRIVMCIMMRIAKRTLGERGRFRKIDSERNACIVLQPLIACSHRHLDAGSPNGRAFAERLRGRGREMGHGNGLHLPRRSPVKAGQRPRRRVTCPSWFNCRAIARSVNPYAISSRMRSMTTCSPSRSPIGLRPSQRSPRKRIRSRALMSLPNCHVLVPRCNAAKNCAQQFAGGVVLKQVRLDRAA